MIILFNDNETLFRNLGLGVLKDARSCEVEEKINDSFEVELVYPYNGKNYDLLKIDRIIYCKPNPYDEPEPFRIYSISKPIKGYVTVKAQHISYDMNGLPVKPISGNGLRDTIDKIQNGCIISHNFKFYTEKSDTKTFKTTNIYNMRALLMGGDESILSVYDLEVRFRKFNVYLTDKIGKNRGATITYAKNLKDISHEINFERLYNGVYPFYHRETTETATDTIAGQFKQCYIVGSKPFQDGWLSYTDGGEPYHPVDEFPVQIASEGDYHNKVYSWNSNLQRYQEKIYNESFTLIDSVTGLLGQESETPSWVVIDWQSLKSFKLVVKAGTDGYFKMSTETEWTHHSKGDVIYEGSVKDATEALVMYYSEVIPANNDSKIEESTNVTHVELDEPIIWIDTELAKSMKVNRILTLDLSSEFDDVPNKDDLETKAKEYIEKNKIGQYKYDTSVSFVDLTQTTEGAKYSNINHVELGDVIKVSYNSVGIDVELRVVSTKYDVINNKYISIDLGEKPDKLSASTIQNGDNISSLTNNVGYTDVTTVNKIIAKTVTADFIKAKNAELSKAQIEQLAVERLNVKGFIEASQFEIDNLVAKMLTADNAVIKQTLEAGTVKVSGDITINSGMIIIKNDDIGTAFRVDRDGNVTANSLSITGGYIKIQDTFEVTNEGYLTALNAKIEGEIIAKSGEIAGFEIQEGYIQYGRENFGEYVHVGTDGIYLGVVNNLDPDYDPDDPSTWKRKFQVDNKGNLYTINAIIKDANVTGTITATSGNIAGFGIHNGYLSYGTKQQANSVYVGTDGIYLGTTFNVTRSGVLTASNVNVSGEIHTSVGAIGSMNINQNGLTYTNAFEIDTSRANYTDPRTPEWVVRASTMEINLLSIAHNSYGEYDTWLSFISSKTKFNDTPVNRGGMLINSSDYSDWNYTYIPSNLFRGMMIYNSPGGDARAVKLMYTIDVTPNSGWSGNTISYNLSSYGDSILSAMICIKENNGYLAHAPTIDWSGTTLTIRSDADSTRKYFVVWVIIEKTYRIS